MNVLCVCVRLFVCIHTCMFTVSRNYSCVYFIVIVITIMIIIVLNVQIEQSFDPYWIVSRKVCIRIQNGMFYWQERVQKAENVIILKHF